MKHYQFLNNLTGWIVFAVAAFTYCLTIEPTASFWDCPEFITTGYKLEVGHPPGAPIFMLTANLFSQFASDPSQVARMVNIMSALMSAGCILFLFWTITHLVRRLVCPERHEMSVAQLITILASGVVGALAYTWSDTFWFSAVEGEVYAYSSLFTAAVFWLILKWESVADRPHSDRYLVLIAYLTGLSIGVHLLNLLCIPAIVLVWYYRTHPAANIKGSLSALIVSAILVAVVLYGIVPGVTKVGGWFELLFVNGFGLPFNTGLIVYIILLASTLIWGISETYTEKSRKRMNLAFLFAIALIGIPFYGYGATSLLIGAIVLTALTIVLSGKIKAWKPDARMMNTALLCVTMILVGYSSYALIVIRSTANTPIRTRRRTSLPWENTWAENNTGHGRCSTDRLTPRNPPSNMSREVISTTSSKALPCINGKRKPRNTKRTATRSYATNRNTSMRKTCCFRASTKRNTRRLTKNGWAA